MSLTGPVVNLIPKHEGMCHSGHSDPIKTLALSQSDWLLWVMVTLLQRNNQTHKCHPQNMGPLTVGVDDEGRNRKDYCCNISNVAHGIVLE